MKPRYSIVRVENNCPRDVCGEEDFCFLSKGKTLEDMCDYCDFLDEKIIIGDTKEQLIKKVAQALLIDEIERYRKAPNCDVNQTIIEHESRICLEKARKIVEFLGVKE